MPDPPESSAGSAPQPPSRSEAAGWTLLGIDWGEKRIGLAIKPAGQDWSLPRGVLTPRGEAEALEAVRRSIEEAGAQGVVVGLPLHPDPAQARQIRRFCRKARRGMRGVRWFFVDERLTSQAADSISLQGAGHRPSDDLAALLILDTFLQSCV